MTVNDLQLAAIFVADSCSHLQVFLTGTIPFLFLLWTYLNIKAVGLQSLTHQFVKDHAGVNTS
jgi:hypothetical protein